MADGPLTVSPELEPLLGEWRKKATPAHVAQYVTRHLPDDSEAKWLPFKHHLYMNQVLVDAATSPERSFLNMSISVRMGKSELISRYLPFWYLGMFPDRDVLIVSNSAANAEKWGLATMNLMNEYGPELFGLSVDRASAGKGEWKIKGHKGTLRAVGIGTEIEGRGVYLGILDDVMGLASATSPTEREGIWSWYTGAYRTRLMHGSTTILVMSRWHLEDLAGKIQTHQAENPGGDPWRTIKLPAVAEAPPCPEGLDPVAWVEAWRNPIGQKHGEPLWPERWPMSDLEQLRKSMTSQTWESRYQQNPTYAEGGMFKVAKWGRRPHVDRTGLRLVRVWDLAATEGGGDWTVGTLVGMDGENRIYVLDVQRFRLEAGGVKAQVKATAQVDGKMVRIAIEQERAGAGKAQLADMKRLLVGYDVQSVKPEGKKEQRAAPYAAQQQDGNVYLIDGPWNEAFIEEHRVFPRGKWDDQVDTVANAVDLLAEMGPTSLFGFEEHESMPMEAMLESSLFGMRPLTIPVG